MSSGNATVKILMCFVLWCALSAISTHGRSLQRIHKNNRYAKVKNLIDFENERDFPRERDDSMDFDDLPVRHEKRRHSRHRQLDGVEDFESMGDTRETGLSEYEERRYRKHPSSHRRSHAIKKRHNRGGDDLPYEPMTDSDEKDFLESRARSMHHRSSLDTLKNRRYEVEVREAQNSSLCNYTVVDVPDPSSDQSRTPKNLVNVICNHAGSRCRDVGSYCCIQTYSKVDVVYGDGTTDKLKIYNGCVCSLRFYGELKPYRPKLPLDD